VYVLHQRYTPSFRWGQHKNNYLCTSSNDWAWVTMQNNATLSFWEEECLTKAKVGKKAYKVTQNRVCEYIAHSLCFYHYTLAIITLLKRIQRLITRSFSHYIYHCLSPRAIMISLYFMRDFQLHYHLSIKTAESSRESLPCF